MSKFYLCTFGCRCNQADSAEMRACLNEASLAETGNPGEARLIVVNSCTVTGRADQQVRQTVRRLHRENPRARLIVTGCYAQRDPEALGRIPGVHAVLGNADRERLLEAGLAGPGAAPGVFRSPLAGRPAVLELRATHGGGRTRPNLRVQDGCDARCSYCIVPSVRGPGRSAAPAQVLEEVRRLVRKGAREIVLTGVHLGAYGRTLPQPVSLVELLRRMVEIPGLGRLRLSSIEAMDFDRGIVELAAGYPILARHFHIPVQSGSDPVLRRMRRPYTAARYLELLEHIHGRLPAAGLGTDVMVGFPGESDADFRATCELVRRSPLTYLHVFPYSKREATEAAAMPDQIPARVVQDRCRILRALSADLNFAFRHRFLGEVLPAVSLAEEEAMGATFALTDNFIHVRISGPAPPPNRLIDIRIDEVLPRGTRASVQD